MPVSIPGWRPSPAARGKPRVAGAWGEGRRRVGFSIGAVSTAWPGDARRARPLRNVGSLDRPGPIPVLRGGQHRDTATLLVVMAARMAMNAAPDAVVASSAKPD